MCSKQNPKKANTVYPCVYREHVQTILQSAILSGLSLCVQGTLIDANSRPENLRFIPVCTGNIKFTIITNSKIAVYPCVYREHQ